MTDLALYGLLALGWALTAVLFLIVLWQRRVLRRRDQLQAVMRAAVEDLRRRML